MRLTSQVVITAQMSNTIEVLENLRTNETIIEIITPACVVENDTPTQSFVHKHITDKVSFSVSDAKLAIEKAYMASDEQTIIILADKAFTPLVQNKLLKVIEEPPKNKIFILVTESKSTVLDTIKSRLPITVLSEKNEVASLALDIGQLSLASVYDFVQEYKRTDAKAMTVLLERIVKEVIASQKYNLDDKTLHLFSNSYTALDMGSPPQFVLNALLLKLLARKKR